jgi:hypothetical protein
MSRRTAPRLAWSLAALSVAMFAGGGALTVLSLSDAPVTQTSSDWGTASALGARLSSCLSLPSRWWEP